MSLPIMIVDDSAMIRMQVRRALTGAGFEVVEAPDGQQAWEALNGGLSVAMVVCDVNMPRMNGIELLEELARATHVAKPPVLMLTTEGQPEMIQRARALGAKGWIIKPFKPDMLLAAVRKMTAMAA